MDTNTPKRRRTGKISESRNRSVYAGSRGFTKFFSEFRDSPLDPRNLGVIVGSVASGSETPKRTETSNPVECYETLLSILSSFYRKGIKSLTLQQVTREFLRKNEPIRLLPTTLLRLSRSGSVYYCRCEDTIRLIEWWNYEEEA